MSVKLHSTRGDTMVEVLFAIAVFALVSVLSIIVMNSGVNTIGATLELSMARNEIDAQSEAIRFIHNSYLSERELVSSSQNYSAIWKRIRDRVNDSSSAILDLTITNCASRYDASSNSESIFGRKTIIFNTRKIDPANPNTTVISASERPEVFQPASLNPRLIYGQGTADNDTTLRESFTNLKTAEGIWIIPVKSGTTATSGQPEFYDFHIYTCWYAPGREIPTTIGTIMRLYNPEMFEAAK